MAVVEAEAIRVRILPDGRMSRADAAAYLGHAVKTLAMWHVEGKGPRSVLVGGKRFYFKSELDRFIRDGAATARKPARADPRRRSRREPA